MDYFFDFSSELSLDHTLARGYLEKFAYYWQSLEGLGEYILWLGERLGEEYVQISQGVFVHKTAKIAPSARIEAPCIICADTHIRQGAYIRGSVLVGENCVVGNSTELKRCILFDGVQTPHFNYVGDSILGYRAHLGAGAITSNVRCDRGLIKPYGCAAGLKKLGAVLGDRVEVGCNSVLNPATAIGADTLVYPLSNVRGVVPSHSIFKDGKVFARR